MTKQDEVQVPWPICTLLLFVATPIIAIVVLAIKLDSPGPVFYQARRIGYRTNVAVPLLRHSVAVDGRTVFTAPSIGGALGLDVEVRFP